MGICCFFFNIFPVTWQLSRLVALEFVLISASSKIFMKSITLECFYFPIPVKWEFTFPMFCRLHVFLFNPKYLKENHNLERIYVLSSLPGHMGIHFFHDFEIVWILLSPRSYESHNWGICSMLVAYSEPC